MTEPLPDLARIAELAAAVVDPNLAPDIANQTITRTYHALSAAIRPAINAPDLLDWCGFAKWSSHTVGLDLIEGSPGLRIENLTDVELPGFLNELPLLPFRSMLVDLLLAVRNRDGIALGALRAGNAVIFLEMASLFVLLHERLADPAPIDAGFARDTAALVQNLHRPALGNGLGREHLTNVPPDALQDGIMFYGRARDDAAHRAEFVLAGNMCFSIYEQDRADQLITIGLCGPARDLVFDLATPGGRGLAVAIGNFLHNLLDLPADRDAAVLARRSDQVGVLREVDDFVARILTRFALVVEIAGLQVRLGEPGGTGLTPPNVVEPMPADVRARLSQGSVADPRDWTRLPYRLGIISQYFNANLRNQQAIEQQRN